MVGCDSLKVVILVRIQVPQPVYNQEHEKYLRTNPADHSLYKKHDAPFLWEG